VCCQAKAPDASLLPIREDAEQLVTTLGELHTQASIAWNVAGVNSSLNEYISN